MGIGGISIWQLLIILAIVIMLFGTKRLRSLGGDLGAAIKGFRSSMSSDNEEAGEDKPAAGANQEAVPGTESGTTETREQAEKPD